MDFVTIFLGNYHDDLGAEITNMTQDEASSSLHFCVYEHRKTGQRAIVIANGSSAPVEYKWAFTHKKVEHADLHRPFKKMSDAGQENSLTINGHGLHVLVEKR